MDYDNKCAQARCLKEATHTVTIRVFADKDRPDVLPEYLNEVRYCLDDALYFAAWLPYCYPDQYDLVSILPPASELFNRS